MLHHTFVHASDLLLPFLSTYYPFFNYRFSFLRKNIILIIGLGLSHTIITIYYKGGQFTVEYLQPEKTCLKLISEYANYLPIKVTEENPFII